MMDLHQTSTSTSNFSELDEGLYFVNRVSSSTIKFSKKSFKSC